MKNIIQKTQNKANPLEEVTCVALRRGLLLCGTEGGRILGFQCSGQFLILLFFDLFSILSNIFFYPLPPFTRSIPKRR